MATATKNAAKSATKAQGASKATGKAKAAPKAKASQNSGDRGHELSGADLKALLAESKAAKVFPNPYRGSYGAIVAALAKLGANRSHSFAKLKATVAALLGKEAWTAFVNRAPRNEATAKSADERLHQNVTVIANRPRDYGRKLVQVGAAIDITKDGKGARSYRLVTK